MKALMPKRGGRLCDDADLSAESRGRPRKHGEGLALTPVGASKQPLPHLRYLTSPHRHKSVQSSEGRALSMRACCLIYNEAPRGRGRGGGGCILQPAAGSWAPHIRAGLLLGLAAVRSLGEQRAAAFHLLQDEPARSHVVGRGRPHQRQLLEHLRAVWPALISGEAPRTRGWPSRMHERRKPWPLCRAGQGT